MCLTRSCVCVCMTGNVRGRLAVVCSLNNHPFYILCGFFFFFFALSHILTKGKILNKETREGWLKERTLQGQLHTSSLHSTSRRASTATENVFTDRLPWSPRRRRSWSSIKSFPFQHLIFVALFYIKICRSAHRKIIKEDICPCNHCVFTHTHMHTHFSLTPPLSQVANNYSSRCYTTSK